MNYATDGYLINIDGQEGRLGRRLLRMFEKRLATYRAIGYARGETPLGLAEPVEEAAVEYDQEAFRHFEEDL